MNELKEGEIAKDYLILCSRGDTHFRLDTVNQAKLVANIHETNNLGHKTGIVSYTLFNQMRQRVD